MRRRRLVAVAIGVGLVFGGVVALVARAAWGPSDARPGWLPDAAGQSGEPPRTNGDVAPSPVLLVWTRNGLPVGLAEQIALLPGTVATTEVLGDPLGLVAARDATGAVLDATEPGFVIPIDAIAVDPATYQPFVPVGDLATFDRLRPGEAILGQTSARLRRLGIGGVLELDTGETLRISAIVDDAAVGGAEVAVRRGTAGVSRPRFVLMRYVQPRADLEASVGDLLPAGVRARFRGAGETPYLRHGDAVLPQVLVKAAFGEFSYRRGDGRTIEIDSSWTRDSIVTADLAILGWVQCHRGIVEPLGGALDELEQANLASLVDVAGFAGCWNPVRISSRPGAGMSRHAWGIAIDLNYPANPEGIASSQDPRLVEVMSRWGFTWGGEWLTPDPSHFEFVAPPPP